MRKMRYLLTAVLISGIAFLNSCSKSSDTTVDQTPAINFTGGSGYVSSDVTLTVNASFQVGISAFSNTASRTVPFTIPAAPSGLGAIGGP